MRFVLFTLVIIAWNVQANSSKSFLVGYLDHPHIVEYYLPIIEQAYSDIGQDIELIAVGSKRGMTMLNQGLIDADATRFESTAAQFKNVMIVPPPLVEAYFDLYCVQQTVCDSSVLNDPEQTLATYYGQLDVIHARYPEIKAELFTLDSMSQVQRLLMQGRLSYALLPSDALTRQEYPEFSYYTVGRESTYHVIHKKHAHLVDALSKALAQRIEQARASQ
ncbi:hypothetical protein [Aestuariibacter salexigens]|uniref:hypothetical protein n=1 Tax=Aestuariibacter salexigens TaxID=226010 RepID=UPI0004133516|nr:hypothetical protein [Aestuariibacter salexigens]